MSLEDALEEWGRWSRQDLGSPDGSCENPIYHDFIPSKAWDAGWGDPVAGDPPPPPINEPRAMLIDAGLMRISHDHFRALKRRYHLLRPVYWDELDAAHRALSDCLTALGLDHG